jgi:hypothetical protein
MKSVAAKSGVTSGWRLIASVLLVAFTLQSYITQTHFHDGALNDVGIAKSLTSGTAAPAHGKLPGNNPVDCPFCQAVAHAGAYAMPVTALVFLSLAFFEHAAPSLNGHARAGAAAHSWQSRAPPKA